MLRLRIAPVSTLSTCVAVLRPQAGSLRPLPYPVEQRQRHCLHHICLATSSPIIAPPDTHLLIDYRAGQHIHWVFVKIQPFTFGIISYVQEDIEGTPGRISRW
ncbi:hypothetical protein FA15DRAFT_676538 [Coprinopsis marcescibilis]|uniref:Uncharacterized protein n=1 Tax=Coprinopsis marcescibilis TaxID=230819 RepID=A0A5C3K9R1_COPMA|nr:hypothetical protein FA15DRAFT_676538 [Coprinopsis marcescibilis]